MSPNIMTHAKHIVLKPVDMSGLKKRELRTQFGALCWREHMGKLEVLMITSRTSKRWIIPKGWPMDGATAAEAAATEAWEEAGVVGKTSDQCAGIYTYHKDLGGKSVPVVVAVFPVRVKKLKKTYPEAGLRKLRWMKPSKAAGLVAEPELRGILKAFRPPA